MELEEYKKKVRELLAAKRKTHLSIVRIVLDQIQDELDTYEEPYPEGSILVIDGTMHVYKRVATGWFKMAEATATRVGSYHDVYKDVENRRFNPSNHLKLLRSGWYGSELRKQDVEQFTPE